MKIILIVCDALRYDHVSKNYMPNLTRCAKAGSFFTFCISGGGTTLSSVPTILSSRREYKPDENFPLFLQEAGIKTALIHSNLLLERFNSGWDLSLDLFKAKAPGKIALRQFFKKAGIWQRTRKLRKSLAGSKLYEIPYRRAGTLLEVGQKWMDKQKNDSFMWLHLMDPHIPYMPLNYSRLDPKGVWDLNTKIHDSIFGDYLVSEEERKEIKRLYAEEVRYMDSQLGPFIKAQDPETLLIIMADHGDELGEYGFYSHAPGEHGVIPQLLHIPLIFIGNSVKPQRIDKYASTLNIGPTILDYANVNRRLGYGWSLRPLLEREGRPR